MKIASNSSNKNLEMGFASQCKPEDVPLLISTVSTEHGLTFEQLAAKLRPFTGTKIDGNMLHRACQKPGLSSDRLLAISIAMARAFPNSSQVVNRSKMGGMVISIKPYFRSISLISIITIIAMLLYILVPNKEIVNDFFAIFGSIAGFLGIAYLIRDRKKTII